MNHEEYLNSVSNYETSKGSLRAGAISHVEVDTAAAVIKIIREVLFQPDQEMSAVTTPQDVPGWDSFAMVNIIILIQDEFDIEFGTEELDEIHCIGDLVRITDARLLAHRHK